MTLRKNYPIWGNAVLAALCLLIYYILQLGLLDAVAANIFSHWKNYVPFFSRLSLSLFAIVVILILGGVVERLVERSGKSDGVRYNLIRVVRLATFVLIAIVVIAFLFQNLYAAALSFGIISLVLGFALQAPITSFIAWLYIVFRRPFHVGDRIQFGNLRGDVLEIGYLDTRVRECNGTYLGNDHASGRIIHFPNSVVLKSEFINYAGPTKPFIWNEAVIQVAWTSNLEFVESTLLSVADEDFRNQHPEQAQDKGYAATTYVRDNTRGWLEVVVSYPVAWTDTTARRNRILRRVLPIMNGEPDKVQFPEGRLR